MVRSPGPHYKIMYYYIIIVYEMDARTLSRGRHACVVYTRIKIYNNIEPFHTQACRVLPGTGRNRLCIFRCVIFAPYNEHTEVVPLSHTMSVCSHI